MTGKPFPQSFWVREGLLLAGCYPGDPRPLERDAKLRGLLDCGIGQVLSLMQANEKSHGGRPFEPYVGRLQELASERGLTVDCLSLPIKDASAPSRAAMKEILDCIDQSIERRIAVYLHCWGGHGRTGTVIACHLIRHGHTPSESLKRVRELRRGLPKSHDPFEGNQEKFVLAWNEEG